jgi:uncharacterized membrane protein YeaQ/YmgE (transglycosylase-associated protein family)
VRFVDTASGHSVPPDTAMEDGSQRLGAFGERRGAGMQGLRYRKGTFVGILVWLLVGLIAGFLARLLVPGNDPMGVGGTLLLGLVGSLIGGTLGALIFEGNVDVNAAGIIGSVIGAVIALLIYRSMKGRTA